ncbi:hypothetical protein E6H31_03080 [Candidatus Bathyarchaeota archaeon]|nr:MAG: hypothetical protein E6H31_03080 [Candidatus Bathyarchaeota archaeon]
MSSPDLEAQTTPRIKDALNAAIQRTGEEEFASLSGIETSVLERILQNEGEYVPVAIVTLACQVNRSHNDPEPARSSISECLKGAILRLPQKGNYGNTTEPSESSTRRLQRARSFKVQNRAGRIYDPAALRIAGFSVNLFTFLVLGYFLGGIVLGPLFGVGSCVGVVAAPPWITPCAGSVIGLVFGSVIGLAYTYYYFVKKL